MSVNTKAVKDSGIWETIKQKKEKINWYRNAVHQFQHAENS